MIDHAAVVTTAIMQMIETAPEGELRGVIENYLRDEFETTKQRAAADVANSPDVVPKPAGTV